MNSWTYSFLYRVKGAPHLVVTKACWAIVKLLDWPRGLISTQSFARGATVGEGFLVSSSGFCVNLNPNQKVKVGNGVVCRGSIRVESRGEVAIGDRSYIGDGVIINAMGKITIGHDALIAQGCFIVDNNTHPISPEARARHFASFMVRGQEPAFDLYKEVKHQDIVIGDHAWIGADSIILKGAKIGAGAIVAAGSVVTGDVPPSALFAGNPAAEVRRLE